MSRLLEEEQWRVLVFVKGLMPAAGGITGKELPKFSGVIGQGDLQGTNKAIEEGCAETR
jgi:hypothetical protein